LFHIPFSEGEGVRCTAIALVQGKREFHIPFSEGDTVIFMVAVFALSAGSDRRVAQAHSSAQRRPYD
jgi:hypothetical protein